MTVFEFISVALSFVIGLGVARLLTATVAAFRARREYRLHWLSFVWAAIIFLWLIQYWWAIFELNLIIEQWAMWRFGFLLGLAMLLFAAAALILPIRPREDLEADFDHNGRWALLILGIYFISGVVANRLLFGLDLFAPLNLLGFSMAICPLAAFSVGNGRARTALTLLCVPVSLYGFFQFSPKLY